MTRKKLPTISQADLKAMIHYDAITGTFTRLVSTGNASQKGTTLDGPTEIKGKTYHLHRLAFLYVTGSMPTTVKRRDGDVKNNMWNNLVAV